MSQKEREELVNKGYLEDVLESKNYVTKEYLDQRLIIQSQDFRQHLDSLMEHQMHQLQVFIEQMDERYVLRREWKMDQGL